MQMEKSRLTKGEALSVSSRFGFFGLGMAGGSIAAACANIKLGDGHPIYPYSGLFVNTSRIDMATIKTTNPKTKKLLIGNGQGAGRDIEIGEEMFDASTEVIGEEFDKIFNGHDFIWVVAGLGGGTGTGTVINALEMVIEKGYGGRFGLILTLPRDSEGLNVFENAMKRLKTIEEFMDSFGSIIFVDNQKLYQEFEKSHKNAPVGDYIRHANRFIAETLHEMNVVTASYKPVAEFNFDSSEFINLISTPGVLHIAKATMDATEIVDAKSYNYEQHVENMLVEGVLSGGYELKYADKLAVSIFAENSMANRVFKLSFIERIEAVIQKVSATASEKPIAQYGYKNSVKPNETQSKSPVYLYAMYAGLDLPTRIQEIALLKDQLVAEKIKLEEERRANKPNLFGSSESITRQKKIPQPGQDLFGRKRKTEENTEKSTGKGLIKNLFDK
ncbi:MULTISPECIES: plasmid replication protein [unclassified Psychrobacillus]|uniref:plasmid replication protein n=1 Tax=unclassified Psychrobacillus TaxID=2636677 RepID=UPI0030F88959